MLKLLDKAIGKIFIVEFLIRIFGINIYFHSYSYFRNKWNILDFLILVFILIRDFFYERFPVYSIIYLRIINALNIKKFKLIVEGL